MIIEETQGGKIRSGNIRSGNIRSGKTRTPIEPYNFNPNPNPKKSLIYTYIRILFIRKGKT